MPIEITDADREAAKGARFCPSTATPTRNEVRAVEQAAAFARLAGTPLGKCLVFDDAEWIAWQGLSRAQALPHYLDALRKVPGPMLPEAHFTEDGDAWWVVGHHDDVHLVRAAVLRLEDDANRGCEEEIAEAIAGARCGKAWLLECCYTQGEHAHVVAEGTRGAEPWTQVLA